MLGRISLRGNVEQALNLQYQLVIEGIVGKSFDGDISVDDLAFNKGPCPTSSMIFHDKIIEYFLLMYALSSCLRF